MSRGKNCRKQRANKLIIADMVETEERKMKEREAAAHEQEEKDLKAGKFKPKKHAHHEAEKKQEKKPEKKREEHDSTKEAKK